MGGGSNFFVFITNVLLRHFYLQLFIGALLYAIYLPKRKYFWARLAGAVVGGMGITYLFFFLTRVETDSVALTIFIDCIGYLLVYATCAAAIYLCFKLDVWSLLFVTTAGYITQNSMVIIYQTILYYFRDSMALWLELVLFYFIWGIMYAGFGYGAYKLYKLIGNKLEFNKQYIITTASVIMFVAIFLGELIVQFVFVDETLSSTPLLLAATLFGLIVNIVCLIAMVENIKSEKKSSELERLEAMYQKGTMQYELAKKNNEILNIRFHDLKHQVDRLTTDKELAAEIKDSLQIYSSLYHTGHRALDIILTEKSLLNREHNIKFLVMADGAILEGMRSSDIYSLFGNLCDNAAEALLPVDDDEKKQVDVSVRKVENFVHIKVENYTDKIPQMVNGLPVTTKSDKSSHGFGVKSIKYIIEKYGGSMKISVDDNIFSVAIILPYPVEAKPV